MEYFHTVELYFFNLKKVELVFTPPGISLVQVGGDDHDDANDDQPHLAAEGASKQFPKKKTHVSAASFFFVLLLL